MRSSHTGPGGWFMFSIEHPISTAPRNPGWLTQNAGHRTWPVDKYLVEGPRVTDWMVKRVIKQHRTLGTTLNLLIRSGFGLAGLEEWACGKSRWQFIRNCQGHQDNSDIPSGFRPGNKGQALVTDVDNLILNSATK